MRVLAQLAFIEVALGAAEVVLQERRLDGLDVRVDAEAFPVHRHAGQAASRRGHTGFCKDAVGEHLVELRGILEIVV